ncbi:YitT family protein [Lentibacillus halophilus]|uniref:YitT family protein n=1 Tax=Lentibacillus halophilus TaxID=295065 RepID=A0ABN0ZI75_9BACI
MTKHWITEYAQIIIGASLVALAYNVFLLPAKLAAGGISGVSTIVFELYSITPAMTQFFVNLPIFIIGWIALGSNFSWKTLVGTVWVPFMIYVTAEFPYTISNPILGTIYGGIILGIGLGTVYKGGGSTGGTGAIAQIVKKFTGLSSGYSQLIVDGFVVISSVFVFNLELTLFALICIFITGKTIDIVQLRPSDSKLVMIITEKEDNIQRLISQQIDRGVTKVRTVGGFSNQDKTMIFCATEQQEAVELKRRLQDEDPAAFVVFISASDVMGRGFSLDKYHGQKF